MQLELQSRSVHLRTVMERYIKDGSTVTLCALDILKAFDRVDHYALLE